MFSKAITLAMATEIKLIQSDNLISIIPLIQQLNPSLSETTLKTRLEEMVAQGYQCAGLYLDDRLIGICGFWMMTKFYVGKHIEPDNVFILPKYRRLGFGKQLLEWVQEYGKSQGCIASELNCYVSNETGNTFWEQEGFEKIGYHYQKPLE
jgi:GNAT superfamily N-acetyltransferase